MLEWSQKPLGTCFFPSLMCIAIGSVVTLVFNQIGVYTAANAYWLLLWERPPFTVLSPQAIPKGWEWVGLCILGWSLAWSVLASTTLWQYVILLCMASSLGVGLTLISMLLGIFWSPFVLLGMLFLTWLFAVMYTLQHKPSYEDKVAAKSHF